MRRPLWQQSESRLLASHQSWAFYGTSVVIAVLATETPSCPVPREGEWAEGTGSASAPDTAPPPGCSAQPGSCSGVRPWALVGSDRGPGCRRVLPGCLFYRKPTTVTFLMWRSYHTLWFRVRCVYVYGVGFLQFKVIVLSQVLLPRDRSKCSLGAI